MSMYCSVVVSFKSDNSRLQASQSSSEDRIHIFCVLMSCLVDAKLAGLKGLNFRETLSNSKANGVAENLREAESYTIQRLNWK